MYSSHLKIMTWYTSGEAFYPQKKLSDYKLLKKLTMERNKEIHTNRADNYECAVNSKGGHKSP